MSLPRPMGESYQPTYFLAALGAGGIAVTFFLYLMFWVPHPGQPVPVFEDISKAFLTGTPAMKTAITVAVLGIAYFAFQHIRLLVWNLRQLSVFQHTAAAAKMRESNAEVGFMAVPLTLAMTVNVGFIMGLVFVPGLWSVVEYLFPLALAAFLTIGIYALRVYGGFLARVFSGGGFSDEGNTSLVQLLPAFALSMIAVGLSAPVAMTLTKLTAGVAFTLSTFFFMAAVVSALIAIAPAVNSIARRGVAAEGAPTLMIAIPILTVLSIAVMRMNHGLHVHFDVHAGKGDDLVFLTKVVSVQLVFALLGIAVLRRQGYFGRFVTGGHETSAGAYALICPAVAFNVLMQFWINKGLAANGIVDKFGTGYWAITALALAVQVLAIWMVVKINARVLGAEHGQAVPAE